MISLSSEDRFKEEISRLRTQNRRYRELIQNLSSMIDIIRSRTNRPQAEAPKLRAFEEFGVASRPPPMLFEIDSSGETPHLSTKGEGSVDFKPLLPNPGWKCLAVDQPQIRIGFTLFGMDAEAIEEAVEVVEQRQVRSRDFTPVFVTDNADFRPFRTRGYVVEYFPSSITSIATEHQIFQRYFNARLELIQAKWGLSELVGLGSGHH